jgi:sec-independent protein translocase protein TatC
MTGAVPTNRQPFVQHLHELRRRLAASALVLGVGAGLGYLARDPILSWLQAPLHSSLYYTKVGGAFEFLMQACLLVGVVFAIPVLVYNLACFVRPALPQPVSRARLLGLVVASSFLTVGGIAFAYYLSLPAVLRFLSSIDVTHLHALIAADSYLSFVISYLAVFAAIFQLPLLITFIDRVTPIPPAFLKRWRKWVILGAFAAALILPIAPDPVSQVMLALPIVVLYEVSIWLVSWNHFRRRPRHSPQLAPVPASVPAPVPTRPQPQRRLAGPRVIDLREHKQT